MTDQRLPWRRRPPGGFVAHPEGEDRPGRVAEIRYEPSGSAKWRWQVTYDLARVGGLEVTSQQAADAATAAWPGARARAAELAAAAAATDALDTLVRRQCDRGDLPLSAFEIETSPSDRLRDILWLIKDRGALGGPAKPLADACSAELYRRRLAHG